MSDSLSIHNIENFKLDIIYYIASIVYKTWWTLEHYKPKYKDEKALHYIKITYLLYNNIRDLPWNLSDKICKTIREGKYEC